MQFLAFNFLFPQTLPSHHVRVCASPYSPPVEVWRPAINVPSTGEQRTNARTRESSLPDTGRTGDR